MASKEAIERHETLVENSRTSLTGAIMVAILAAFLAVASLLGERASVDAVIAQGQANNHWNTYQASVIQQNTDVDIAGMLRAISAGDPQARAALRQEAARLDARVTSEHTRALQAAAALVVEEEKERDDNENKHRGFAYAVSGLEIAIVLCSVALIIRRRQLLWVGGVMGIIAIVIGAEALFSVTGVKF